MTDTPIAEENGRRVLQKTARGIFWNFVAYGLSKVVVLITTSILARLLSKDDFGLVALAVVAINYLAVIKDLGLGVALIQRREEVNEAANTVFTINLIFGVILSLVLIPIAPLVADYFNNPMVTPVLRWLGLSFFLGALGSVHVVWLMRELDYRRKLIPDMGSALVKGAVSIGLALAGYGVWALVFGQLSGVLSSIILYWIIVPWRPRFALDPKITGALMKFGSSIFTSDIVNVSIDNLGYIIIGRVFGAVQLGVYTLAFRLPEMLVLGNLWIMASVTYPAFANIQDDLNNMRRGFLGSIRMVGLIVVPICLGLIIAADPIIRVVFGDQWADAIPILRILALYTLIASVGYHVGDVYKAIGRPGILLNMTILTLILMAITLTIGSRFGLEGIAWGYVTAMFIERVISLFLAAHYIKLSLREILSQLIPSTMGGVVMAVVTLGVLFLTNDFPVLIQLVLVVLSGAVSYLGVLWRTERDNLTHLIGVIRSKD